MVFRSFCFKNTPIVTPNITISTSKDNELANFRALNTETIICRNKCHQHQNNYPRGTSQLDYD
jgi:hypothetical protein